MKKGIKVSLIITGVLLLLVLAGVFLWNYLFGGLKYVEIDRSELGIEVITKSADIQSGNDSTVKDETATQTEGVKEETGDDDSKKMHGIKNIAMFGMSISEVGGIDTNRSDMNLIISIDFDNNRACFTSVLRDSKVSIEGHDPQKINAAYKYGGATLAIKTLNQNFHLDIADYVTVNFMELIEIVDKFGGVDIELTAAEATQVPGTVEGMNHLNGEQAKEYCRIRYIDSDYYRASRQQNVFMALLNIVKELPKTSYPEVIHELMGCFETSMTFNTIMDIVNSIDINSVQIVRNTVPDKNYDENLWGEIDNTGSWVYVYDIEEAADRIHRIIYEGSPDGAKPSNEALTEDK